jgi:hypothetical protein
VALIKQGRLALDIEWEAAPGVTAPELQATWSRFEMHIGDAVLTLVYDLDASSARRSIYVPLYPLAEWIVFNWWQLRANYRPRSLGHRRTARSRSVHHRPGWLDHHNLRAAGDGFLWPDLTILPGVGTTRLLWQADHHQEPDSRVRFLSSGLADVASGDVEAVLTTLVGAVLARLDDAGVVGTALATEWEALRELDSEEAAFCAAAARLGLDPLALGEETAEKIVAAGKQFEGPLLDDLLDSAEPSHLNADLDWIVTTSDLIRSSEAPVTDLPPLEAGPLSTSAPWERGIEDARTMRQRLGRAPGDRIDLDPWVTTLGTAPLDDRTIQGMGGRSANHAWILALPQARSPEARRFAQARALWRCARFGSGDPRFLVTGARTPLQQAERAFAAELLAPAEALRELFGGEPNEPVDLDDLALAGRRFEVNDWVIGYQAINQLHRDVDDPSLPAPLSEPNRVSL